MPLTWSEPAEPNADCSYTHIIAQTPLGPIRLEWKGWKDDDTPCGHMPWGDFVLGKSLKDAKELAQETWDEMVKKLMPFTTRG